MQLSGFINSGISLVPATPVALSPGVNAPVSKISGSGFMMSGVNALSRSATASAIVGFGGSSTNYLYLGKIPATLATANFTAGSLTPEDAFNLDAKMDDGIVNSTTFSGAASGNFRAVTGDNNTGCQTAGGYTVATTTTACLVGMALN